MYSGRNTLTFRTRTVTFFKINLLLLKVQNIYINFLFKTVPDTSLYETSNLREAMKLYHGGNMYASGSEKRSIYEKTLQRIVCFMYSPKVGNVCEVTTFGAHFGAHSPFQWGEKSSACWSTRNN